MPDMVLRIQSKDGTKRISIDINGTTSALYEKIFQDLGLTSYSFTIYLDRGHQEELRSSRSIMLRDLGLRHGDILYLEPIEGADLFQESSSSQVSSGSGGIRSETTASTSTGSSSVTTPAFGANGNEDDVDVQLWRMDGKIKRKRDPNLCRHGEKGQCIHCSSLEPFDESYLSQHNVKHMSFHTYLRKLTAGVDRGKFLLLEDINCGIKSGCKDHPPWPKGICSKCQPSAIILSRQEYRHVDNVMFENSFLVENFLNYWRVTGHQRIGFLYGKYEIHADVPLGIRATVVAIYEPPQESSRDKITLLPDEKEEIVEDVARKLGLQRVGWIFTDLIAEDVQTGTVKYVRGIESHFLTAQECIMAGIFQNSHPNPCRASKTGFFGSKFVTVCVTGDATNQVHMEGYSVSNQCMGLVREEILLPTVDASELGYIRESTDKKYVPDVFYKETDKYGNKVLKLARPLPVEYLLVDVPTSTPLLPQYTFPVNRDINAFPVENRPIDGHVQDFNALINYLLQFPPYGFADAISNFHVLIYIAQNTVVPLKDHMDTLLAAIRAGDRNAVNEWKKSEQWMMLEQLVIASIQSSGGGAPPTAAAGSSSDVNVVGGMSPNTEGPSSGAYQPFGGTNFGGPVDPGWTCSYCTYANAAPLGSCDMCGLPR